VSPEWRALRGTSYRDILLVSAQLSESRFNDGCRRQPDDVGKRWATYPANLCLLLLGGEFAEFGSDFGEAVGQPIEYGRTSATGVR
jgi:hypothetical protein